MPRKIKTSPPLGKQVKELREELGLLRKQVQMISFKLAEDLKVFEERTMCNWQYLWSLVEALKEDAKFEWLTEERLDQLHQVVVGRWKGEALETLKKKLGRGQAVCTKCHFVGGGPQFFEGDSEGSVCPNCEETGSVFLKETSTVAEEANP